MKNTRRKNKEWKLYIIKLIFWIILTFGKWNFSFVRLTWLRNCFCLFSESLRVSFLFSFCFLLFNFSTHVVKKLLVSNINSKQGISWSNSRFGHVLSDASGADVKSHKRGIHNLLYDSSTRNGHIQPFYPRIIIIWRTDRLLWYSGRCDKIFLEVTN